MRRVCSGGGGRRLAGSGDKPRWRVFVSHTSEVRDFPKGTSYLAAAERAIIAAGHVPVDMTDFPAADRAPADLCEDRVRSCDIYLGILGTRYGSPVRDKPDVSYTELEFGTATDAGLDRLMFLLDTEVGDVGIPLSRLIDREYGQRQDDFRRRVQESKLVTRSFASPDELQLLVERSLRELADTRTRLRSGIQREQVPADAQPIRASKFVNPPPAVAPTWFQGRQAETARLAGYLSDPGIRLVTVTGPGGIGKTATVCRLLKGLESGRIPGADGDSVTVGGIVYLSRNGVHKVEYPTLVADLLRLLPAEEAGRLERLYQNPQHNPAAMMLALLEAFPAGEPVVVLLDNLESVMDTERESLAEPALHEALSTVLTAPAHAITMIATTRVTPAVLLDVEPARQRQLRLTEGLAAPDARIVLRELDDDGRLGLRDALDDLLDGLCQHTRGNPRALEAVKAILDGDETLTPADLLDRTRKLPGDRVVQVLVGEAYELLDNQAQRVMQALSVFPAPVSAVGVDFLLRPVDPTTDAAPILTRLVRRQLVRFQNARYNLHPLDREYARARLPAGRPGDSRTAFTLTGLQARAADYYAQIRTPRQSWRTLEDLRPQLAEFELRCDTGDYDTAATVLRDIDYNYLKRWGHYRTLVELHGHIRGRITDPAVNASHLGNLGLCHYSLGEYQQAIALNRKALAIARRVGYRVGECIDLGNLGLCHYSLGEYRQTVDLQIQALAIARDIGHRYLGASALDSMGQAWLALGDAHQAVALLGQAMGVADATGDIEPAVDARSWLARAHLQLGAAAAALALTAVERELTYPLGEPAMHLLKGLALLELNYSDESAQAFTEAAAAADALLTLADRNVAALEMRALALSGLAVVTGDQTRAAEAAQAFARARAVTRAAGVVADTRRLLGIVTAHDHSGLLATLDPD